MGSGRHNPSPPVAESIERSGGFREVTMPWQYRNSKVCCIGHAPIGAWSTVSAVTVSDVFLTRQKNNFLAFLSCCDTIFCIFSIPMGSGWEHRDKKLESCMHYFRSKLKLHGLDVWCCEGCRWMLCGACEMKMNYPMQQRGVVIFVFCFL